MSAPARASACTAWREAPPARRLGREHIVEAGQIAFERELTAGGRRTIDMQLEREERHRRIQQALGVGLALRERRTAEAADALGEGFGAEGLD